MRGFSRMQRRSEVSSWGNSVLRQRTERMDTSVCEWAFTGLGEGAQWRCEESLSEGASGLLLKVWYWEIIEISSLQILLNLIE